MTVLDINGNPIYNRRPRPHGTAGEKKQWKQNKYRQPPPPKYLLYSKTFNRDSKGQLWWSKGVTFKGSPTITSVKNLRWDLKERLKRERRQAKRQPAL